MSLKPQSSTRRSFRLALLALVATAGIVTGTLWATKRGPFEKPEESVSTNHPLKNLVLSEARIRIIMDSYDPIRPLPTNVKLPKPLQVLPKPSKEYLEAFRKTNVKGQTLSSKITDLLKQNNVPFVREDQPDFDALPSSVLEISLKVVPLADRMRVKASYKVIRPSTIRGTTEFIEGSWEPAFGQEPTLEAVVLPTDLAPTVEALAIACTQRFLKALEEETSGKGAAGAKKGLAPVTG